ncbi:Neuropeptide FF receptor 2 [Stylophora pistillata]|uniref:Neuropeptide FF receptor 2 n=1 Tax=Stylophora pistillata TaxID=50429 RepID=A0A2B4SWY4_STYPI|nr:Neuropeptide FF receptor 2 [Stylophora pistillata]
MNNITGYRFPPTANTSIFSPTPNSTQLVPTNQKSPSGNFINTILTSSFVFVITAGVIDLLVAVILGPLRVAELFIGWPLGEFFCRFLAPFQEVIVCVSAVTHTLIALERHRGIVTPFKPKLSIPTAKIAIAVIWCTCCLTIGLPLALVLKEVELKGKKYCKASWPSIHSRQVYEVFLITAFIVVPLIMQTATYIKIVATIKKEDASSQTISRSGTVEQRRNQIRKKAHLVKMLVILVAVFQVCFIPRGIYMLVYEFASASYKEANRDGMMIANISTILIFYLKHVLNPFILFAMSTEFRNNCFPRKLCKNNSNFASSMSRYMSKNSRTQVSRNSEVFEEKEMSKLCDSSSPDVLEGKKGKAVFV